MAAGRLKSGKSYAIRKAAWRSRGSGRPRRNRRVRSKERAGKRRVVGRPVL